MRMKMRCNQIENKGKMRTQGYTHVELVANGRYNYVNNNNNM